MDCFTNLIVVFKVYHIVCPPLSGSRNSESSHSPPIAALPNGVSWKPLISPGSPLKPIVLGDDGETKGEPGNAYEVARFSITATTFYNILQRDFKVITEP